MRRRPMHNGFYICFCKFQPGSEVNHSKRITICHHNGAKSSRQIGLFIWSNAREYLSRKLPLIIIKRGNKYIFDYCKITPISSRRTVFHLNLIYGVIFHYNIVSITDNRNDVNTLKWTFQRVFTFKGSIKGLLFCDTVISYLSIMGKERWNSIICSVLINWDREIRCIS